MKSNRAIARAFGFTMLFMLLCGGLAHAVEPPVRIMPLGDSITYGEGPLNSEGGYRDLLYAQLSTAGYNVDFVGTLKDSINHDLPDKDHEGHPAYRVDQINTEVGGWLSAIADPDVILLQIGTNDFLQGKQPPAVLAELDNLIANLAIQRPFAKIIVSTLILSTFSPAVEANQIIYNQGIPALVAQHAALGRQVSMLDLHPVLNAGDLEDNVHPTTAGYDKMANAWMPAIQNVIQPKGTSNPPLIAKATTSNDLTQVAVTFSKPVEDAAVNLSNFTSSGGLTISNAVLDSATKRTVTLTTSPQTPGVSYTITVDGVKDRTTQARPIAPQSKAMFHSSRIGNGSFENLYAYWGTHTGHIEIVNTVAEPQYGASNGSKVAVFNRSNTNPNGVISQSFTTTPGSTYHLTFDMGVASWRNSWNQKLAVSAQGSDNLLQYTSVISGTGGGGKIAWFPWAFDFIANSTTTTLTFTDVSSHNSSLNLDLLLDNIHLTTSPPPWLCVTSSPYAGTHITVSPTDLNGNGNGSTGLIRSYSEGTSVTLTAPATSGGANFLKWQNNGADVPGTNRTVPINMDSNNSFNAVYASNGGPPEPVAVGDSYVTDEDTALTVTAPGVLVNDSQGGSSPLTAVMDGNPSHGSVVLNPDGSFTYTPAANHNGSDSFTYHANNGVSNSTTATVNITIHPVNDAPVANDDSGSADEDNPVTVSVLANDSDIDSTISIQGFSQGTHGSVTQAGNDLIYTPAADFHGTDTFTYTITDGALTDTATVNITIHPVNDAPVANDNSGSADEDNPVTVFVLANDSDIDSTISIQGFSQGTHGSVTQAGNDLIYTPAADFHGTDTFTYTITDGALTDTATVNITIHRVGGSPFTEWLTSHGIVSGPLTDSDQDSIGDAVEYVIGGNPATRTDVNLLPSVAMVHADPDNDSFSTDYLVFTYRRTERTKNDPLISIRVEWTSDISGIWTEADGSHNEVFIEGPQQAGPNTDFVHVYIPLPPEGKFFARLKVVVHDE